MKRQKSERKFKLFTIRLLRVTDIYRINLDVGDYNWTILKISEKNGVWQIEIISLKIFFVWKKVWKIMF
jgi:hypothetical protein